jgi:hypothetical protein
MTWEELLANLRSDLEDERDTPRWSDERLFMYTRDAVNDYSLWFPRRVDGLEIELSGDFYPLPDDFVSEVSIESPKNAFLERRLEIPGRRYRKGGRPTTYFIEGGNVYLNGTPLQDDGLFLTYYALHLSPDDAEDLDFEFTIPDMDMELIRLYVQGKIHAQMRSRTSRLDRFKPGSGRRDDNPLSPETESMMEEYYSKIASRIGGKVIRLYRVGRMM